jgi:hypothetical protein
MPAPLGCLRSRQRPVVVDDAEGVELGLQPIESIEKEPCRFDRRQRSLAVKGEQRGCRCVSDVLAGTHCSPVFSTHSKIQFMARLLPCESGSRKVLNPQSRLEQVTR